MSSSGAKISAGAVADRVDDLLPGLLPGLLENLLPELVASPAPVPPATPEETWRPAEPIGAERVSGLVFPVVRGPGNFDVALPGGTGTPTPHRLYIEAGFTSSTVVKVFDDTGPREFNVTAATEADFADVLEFESQGAAVVQFQVGAGGATFNDLSFRQIAATRRYCKMGGDTAAPSFPGGSVLAVDVPIPGTDKRVAIQWAGNNAVVPADDDLRPAYSAQVVFPESAYVANFHSRQRNSGSDVIMTAGNNDHIFDVYPAAAPSAVHELRGDVHGGESPLTGNPAADFTVAYDVLGDGTWRTHTVGAPFRQAARVRATQHTKIKTSGGALLWHFTKVWTVYADGTVRQDRTSVAQSAHRLRDWYYWMVSGDPAKALLKVACNRHARLATLAADDLGGADYFGGTHSLMYDPAAGVALAIGIDRALLLGYRLTTAGNSGAAPPPGPRFEDGQLNGDLNKLYTFLRLNTEDVPAGYRIDSTQWQKFFAPTDLAYPERDLDTSLGQPEHLVQTYPG